MALPLTSLTLFCIQTRLNSKQGHALQGHRTSMASSKNILCVAGAQIIEPMSRNRASYWDFEYIKSLQSDYTDATHKIGIEDLKENVRNLLDKSVDPLAKLEFIDDIERLGVGYHFKDQIKSVIHNVYNNKFEFIDEDLYSTALRFRLLRQHGYDVPEDIFKCFKDEKSNFKECLCKDVKGMLSLYEASHLSFEGESIMDEAKEFTTKHLKEPMEIITPTLSEKVAHSLELPFHWRLPRAEARWYIDIYDREKNMNPVLLQLAKLDYNMVQATYQKEIANIVRWWEDLGLQQLGFLRGKMMICFIWSIGMAFEPQFGHLREEITKLTILLTVLDDIYDTRGSLEELELFTDAVERWEVGAMEQLPQYMKLCYMAVLNTNNIIGYKIMKEQDYDITLHQKKAWVDLCKSFLMEAKWFHEGYTPTSKEYFDTAVYSVGAHIGLVNYYFLITNKITREALEYIETLPSPLYWTSMMVRLANDAGTFTDKEKKGSIQIYMHEIGVSGEVAREHIRQLIGNIWKKMNKATISSQPLSETFTGVTTNICQLAQCIFMFEDGHVDPNVIWDNLMALVFEPIPLK